MNEYKMRDKALLQKEKLDVETKAAIYKDSQEFVRREQEDKIYQEEQKIKKQRIDSDKELSLYEAQSSIDREALYSIFYMYV